MCDLPIIDSHLHIWDIQRLRYPWLDGFPELNRTFTLRDFDMACRGVDVRRMVFLNCEPLPEQNLAELAWVDAIADEDKRLAAIVPYVAVEQGDDIADQIEMVGRYGRVRGIRRLLQGEPEGFALQPAVVDAVRRIGANGMHFEITVAATQLPEALELVQRCPDVPFILDHCGNPDIAGGGFEPWRSDLEALAECERVTCKVSNLTNNADLARWTVDDITPYFDAVVEVFGPTRVMWAGDWPHALRSVTYSRWVEVAEGLTAAWSSTDRLAFFHDNAARVYRLQTD